MQKQPYFLLRWMIIFALVTVYSFSLLILWRKFPEIASENSLMENLQALSLAVGVLTSGGALVLPGRQFSRFVLMLVAVALLSFFLREVDVEKLDLPIILIALGSGAGRNLLIGGTVLILVTIFFKNFATLKPQVCAFFKHETCLPFYFGIAFYLIGDVFDKHLLDVPRETRFVFEEVWENVATCFLLLGAVWTARWHSKTKKNRKIRW